jgi:hypothetical protein
MSHSKRSKKRIDSPGLRRSRWQRRLVWHALLFDACIDET